jgi:hypothetical protein
MPAVDHSNGEAIPYHCTMDSTVSQKCAVDIVYALLGIAQIMYLGSANIDQTLCVFHR